MFNAQTKYRVKGPVVEIPFDEVYLIIPLKRNMIDFTEVYSVNSSGLELWKRLKMGHKATDIAQEISQNHPIKKDFILDIIQQFGDTIEHLLRRSND